MKKYLFTLSLLFLISGLAFSQNYNFQYIIQKVNSQAGLSQEQRIKLIEISADYYPKAMEINDSNTTDEIKIAKAFLLKTQLDGDLKNILTDAQFKEYEKMCDDYEKKHFPSKKK
jgi:hypothetical protein